MTQHHFKKGEPVKVFNRTFSGKVFYEGLARVVARIIGMEDQYVVSFYQGDRAEVERYVDPLGQSDPDSFVAMLNAGREDT